MTSVSARHLAAVRTRLMASADELARPLAWVGASPWGVLVAEVMLQQTQTSRVAAPWRSFCERFSDPSALARAPLAEVLRAWDGLGFHRRARMLHEAAKIMVRDHDGLVPSSPAALRALPGVGEYTAHAVASFAFDAPVAVLDTNVGRVLARCVANEPLKPAAARSMAAQLLGRAPSARFNQAMLDLGAQFCTATPRCASCPLRRTCAWRRHGGDDPAPRSAGVSRPQAPFAGSERQLRGQILAVLRVGPASTSTIHRSTTFSLARVRVALDDLVREGLVEPATRRWSLAGDQAQPGN